MGRETPGRKRRLRGLGIVIRVSRGRPVSVRVEGQPQDQAGAYLVALEAARLAEPLRALVNRGAAQ